MPRRRVNQSVTAHRFPLRQSALDKLTNFFPDGTTTCEVCLRHQAEWRGLTTLFVEAQARVVETKKNFTDFRNKIKQDLIAGVDFSEPSTHAAIEAEAESLRRVAKECASHIDNIDLQMALAYKRRCDEVHECPGWTLRE